MKRVSVFLSLPLLLLASIQWHTDFDKAFALAKKTNRPLFVFIERHDPPCRWCRLMKRTTLADDEIATYINSHYIPVKLVREEGNYPDELYPLYVPTIYIITPDERIVKKIVGYWSSEDFWSDLHDVEQLLAKSASLRNRAAKSDTNSSKEAKTPRK